MDPGNEALLYKRWPNLKAPGRWGSRRSGSREGNGRGGVCVACLVNWSRQRGDKRQPSPCGAVRRPCAGTESKPSTTRY